MDASHRSDSVKRNHERYIVNFTAVAAKLSRRKLDGKNKFVEKAIPARNFDLHCDRKSGYSRYFEYPPDPNLENTWNTRNNQTRRQHYHIYRLTGCQNYRGNSVSHAAAICFIFDGNLFCRVGWIQPLESAVPPLLSCPPACFVEGMFLLEFNPNLRLRPKDLLVCVMRNVEVGEWQY